MFTGIVEEIGVVLDTHQEGSNIRFELECGFQNELRVDQSVSHNGVCLTIERLNENGYEVVAIDETLSRSNLGHWEKGSKVNLERSMRADGRFEGHIVQGHVDNVGIVREITDENGSWRFVIGFDENSENLTVEKGSICVNGVSLTVVASKPDWFSVAIIPYTYENTNFKELRIGDQVNLEFDILGKYLAKYFDARKK